jgi:hypothetical protein
LRKNGALLLSMEANDDVTLPAMVSSSAFSAADAVA